MLELFTGMSMYEYRTWVQGFGSCALRALHGGRLPAAPQAWRAHINLLRATTSSSPSAASQLGVMGHMNFEISVADWAPELTTSGAISPPRLPDTTDGPTAEMRPKLEVTETS